MFKELQGASGNGGNVLKWDRPGQVVEGRLVATKRGRVFNGRPTTLAIIKQSDGVDVTIPLTTVLESRFLENSIQNGSILRITYTGKEMSPSSKLEYKAFKLEIDDAPPLASVPGLATTAPAGTSVSTPSAAEIEAAKAMLAGLNKPTEPQAPVSEYDRLFALLVMSNPKGAAAIKGALESLYAEGAERLDALKSTLTQQGIKVEG